MPSKCLPPLPTINSYHPGAWEKQGCLEAVLVPRRNPGLGIFYSPSWELPTYGSSLARVQLGSGLVNACSGGVDPPMGPAEATGCPVQMWLYGGLAWLFLFLQVHNG